MRTPLQLAFVAAALIANTAVAQIVTWTGALNSELNDSANWAGFPGTTSQLVFDQTGQSTDLTVSGVGLYGSLRFTGTFVDYRFRAGANPRLSLGAGIDVAGQPGSRVRFDAEVPIELAASQTWSIGSDTDVRGVISGDFSSLTKTGTGTLTLEGANTYAGGTTVSSGTLIARNGSGSATGAGPVTIGNGATLQIGTGGTAGAIGGAIVNNGLLRFNRGDALPRFSSGITAYYIHGGVISGAGSVTVASGVLGLSGANTYAGATTISGGRLIALNTSGSATGTGDVTVANDNASLQIGRGTASGSIDGNVQLATPRAALLIARSDDFIFNGRITGAGTLQIGYGGSTGSVTLRQPNTYTGGTFVNGGSLGDAVANAYPSTGAMFVDAGATLYVNFPETIGGLRGAPVDSLGDPVVSIANTTVLTIHNAPGNADVYSGFVVGGGAMVKTGSGLQELGGLSTYSGGTTVQQGTLVLGRSSSVGAGGLIAGPVGSGTLTLADGAGLATSLDDVSLLNALNVGTNVTLYGGKFDDATTILAGDVTFTNATTVLHVKGFAPVILRGTISGPAATSLTVDAGNALVFAGTVSGNIQSMLADAGGLIFASDAALPAGLSIHAVNGGYVGLAASGASTPPPASTLISRIANPTGFSGTFGFDSDDEDGPIRVFHDSLDFSAFTAPQFRIGSASEAILAGAITPPTVNGAPLYPFGGPGGHLGVASDLGDVGGTAAAVLVSSLGSDQPQFIIFRGQNSYTGSNTFDGATAPLVVANALAVLDSAGALPASAKFAFGSSGPAYVGATSASFADFADFAGHLASGGYNARSILGVDSNSYYTAKIAHGPDAEVLPEKIGTSIDLSSFSSIYLGSASDVILYGPITPSADRILHLTAVDEGRLTIASALESGVDAVVVGMAGTASSKFSDGVVTLARDNTFAGGTTLFSGTLELAAREALGTGALTVQAGGISAPNLRGPDGEYFFVGTPIVLNTTLQLNRRDEPSDVWRPAAFATYGTISGTGGLDLFDHVILGVANTYSGGTHINAGAEIFIADGALGSGAVNVDGGTRLEFEARDGTLANALFFQGGTTTLESPATLAFAGAVTVRNSVRLEPGQTNSGTLKFMGGISGPGSLTFAAPATSRARYELSGTNTYTGGTVALGTTVVFQNDTAVPTAGLMSAMNIPGAHAGYIGAAFTTNLKSSFLDRFDRAAMSGVIGLDSADTTSPNVFSEALDLTGFSPSVRVASSTAATLAGTLTPAGANYQFGDGGGTLTVTSALTGSRRVEATSSADPLTLVLRGNNTYTGGTAASRSVVRFDGAAALPASGALDASHGYIGITETVNLSLTSFLARFASAVDGVVGLDSANLSAPRTVTDAIDLAPYSALAGVYLGTSTALTLDGPITAPGSTLRLAAVGDGSLVVNSAITNSYLSVGAAEVLSSRGTVTLNAANPLLTGVDLNAGRLLVGHSNALGSGSLSIHGSGDTTTLGTNTAGLTLVNPITADHGFTIDGTNSFTLSGAITAFESLRKTGAGTVQLSAHNALGGTVSVDAGVLVFGENDSLGHAGLRIASDAEARFLSAAPVIEYLLSAGDLTANPGILRLADGSAATILSGGYFYGTITGNGSLIVSAPVDSQSSLGLRGANTYTGGSTIRPNATLTAEHNEALGSVGQVTLDGGTLAVERGVTLTFTRANNHALVFNSGTLRGAGSIVTDSPVTIGSGRTLKGGTFTADTLALTFNAGSTLVFDSGGTLKIDIADAGPATGLWGRIALTGTLDVTATAAMPFNLSVGSMNPTGTAGWALNFDPTQTYTWTILTATAITGFDAAKFKIDASGFGNMPVDIAFSIAVNDLTAPTSLLLNYNPAAIPEPSTWALLVVGAVGAAFALRRRLS